MEDLITDFMCEPAEMDDWLSTAATSHSGQSSSAHDPGGLVGSSQGTGFFSRGDSPRDTARHRPGRLAVLFIFLTRHSFGKADWSAVLAPVYKTEQLFLLCIKLVDYLSSQSYLQ